MTYPRTIVLEDAGLLNLLTKKGGLIEQGRAKSEEVEKVEKEMAVIDEQIQELEKQVPTDDIDAEAKEVTEAFNAVMQKMGDVKKRLGERMKTGIAPDVIALYEAKKKEKEALEAERNKFAMKVQQVNDKIIPMTRKLMAPYLQDKWEDCGTMELKDGKIEATIFSHLDDFEKAFEKKRKK